MKRMVWEPVEDGEYEMGKHFHEPLYIFQNLNPEICTQVEYGGESIILDRDMAICRRVPATQPPQAMPYSHRNGETDAPTVEGWYWCYWKSQDGTIDTAPGGGIPMEWYNGCWRDNQVGAPFKGIPPAICYGPITPPWDMPAPQPPQAMPQPDSAPIVFEVGAPEHTAMARVLANTMGDLSEEVYAAGWMRDCEYEIWQELQGEKPHWFICDANDRATLKLLSGMVDGWIMWDDEIGGTRFVPMSEWLSRHDEWLQRRPTPAP